MDFGYFHHFWTKAKRNTFYELLFKYFYFHFFFNLMRLLVKSKEATLFPGSQ